MLFFLAVVPAILLAATGFVSATWIHFWGFPRPGWQLVPMLLTAGFIPLTLLGTRWRSPLLRIAYAVSSVALGLLSFGLLAAAGCWIVAGVARLGGWPLNPRWPAGIFFGGALAGTAYGVMNAAWIRVTRFVVPLRHLPAAWQGRTVALVTDLHLGNIRGLRFVRRLTARLKRLQPHAVFVSGDMFDGTEVDADRLVQPWMDFRAPAGVYFSSGNHEEFIDRARFLPAIARAGIRVLNNEKVVVDGLQIVGVHDAEAGDERLFREILQAAALDRGRASILLTHQPANLAVAEAAGISLQLSGHTHGGQFWPWTRAAARVHRQFVYGMNRLGGLIVLTSSGVGTWGPPLRVGTRSEIVLIRLEDAEAIPFSGPACRKSAP